MKIKAVELLNSFGDYGLPEKYHDKVYYFRKKVVNVIECIPGYVNVELEDGSISYHVDENKEFDLRD